MNKLTNLFNTACVRACDTNWNELSPHPPLIKIANSHLDYSSRKGNFQINFLSLLFPGSRNNFPYTETPVAQDITGD